MYGTGEYTIADLAEVFTASGSVKSSVNAKT